MERGDLRMSSFVLAFAPLMFLIQADLELAILLLQSPWWLR